MNESLQIFFALIFIFCILFAMISDYQHLRIPNMASIVLALAFIPYALLGGVSDIWPNLILAATIFVVLFIFFMLRWIGAGDVKLAAAIMLWAGPVHGVDFVMLLALIGGVFALGLLILRRALLFHPILGEMPVLSKFSRWARNGLCPYGLPIGLAALCVVPSIFAAS